VLPDFNSTIAFSYQPDGIGHESNIFAILSDGANDVQITDTIDGLPYDFAPAWSADGTMLAFEAHQDKIAPGLPLGSYQAKSAKIFLKSRKYSNK